MGAGRTDTGVHAKEMYAYFEQLTKISKLLLGLILLSE
jgi:tRNA U38,U39,U40 pseudouridine synthase TruA